MSDGWICLHRSLLDKGFYRDSEYVHLWVHLLMKVNHEPKEFLFNGKMIKVDRGQCVTGRNVLFSETGISTSKVYRILKTFEIEHQIEQQKTNKFTLITVINYKKYQDREQKNEQRANSKRTASEQPLNTNNNVTTKQLKPSSPRTKFSETDMACAKWIFEKIQNLQPERAEPNFKSWADTIRLMVERDGRGHRDICELFAWANNDEFWKTNILSPSKLREKWDDLQLKRRSNGSGKINRQAQPNAFDRAQQKLYEYERGDSKIVDGEVLVADD